MSEINQDHRDANEVLIAAGIAAVVGAFSLLVLYSAGMYEPLVARAPEPTTFTACPDCHTERRPANGCGKLRDQAWIDCADAANAF